jgi:molybdenum-dependent DNA-binding transcriptional regulator ModE
MVETSGMVGRKPLGPALVDHLDGSARAKERLELILATIAGKVSVVAAAQQLGISEAMFYKLRNRVLQVSLEDLEPKPIGRPVQRTSAEGARGEKLAARVTELERELTAQTVRLELAQTMPHVIQPHLDQPASPAALKKTNRRAQQKRKLRQRQARRKSK